MCQHVEPALQSQQGPATARDSLGDAWREGSLKMALGEPAARSAPCLGMALQGAVPLLACCHTDPELVLGLRSLGKEVKGFMRNEALGLGPCSYL